MIASSGATTTGTPWDAALFVDGGPFNPLRDPVYCWGDWNLLRGLILSKAPAFPERGFLLFVLVIS